jgi:hypothetical protein
MLSGLPLLACQSTKVHRTDIKPDAGIQSDITANIIPQTGQKISYAAGDDGNLRIGKPWPSPRFADNGDGTVTDQLTGLMWTKNADQANGTLDWEEALLKSADCDVGDYTDWRLPNRKELESLIDLGSAHPALPSGHPFENVRATYYWSSTTTANGEDSAWVLHFYIGMITNDDKGGTHHVWYVRGGR